ncbi:hypothetical protein Tco_0415116 [Tanacetum coccineum]
MVIGCSSVLNGLDIVTLCICIVADVRNEGEFFRLATMLHFNHFLFHEELWLHDELKGLPKKTRLSTAWCGDATEKDEIIHSLAWQRIAFAAMAGKHGTIAALNALNAETGPTRFPTVNEKLPKADESRNATAKDEIIHSFGKHGTIAALNTLNAKNGPTRVFALTVISDGADIVMRNSFTGVKQNLLSPLVGHIRGYTSNSALLADNTTA